MFTAPFGSSPTSALISATSLHSYMNGEYLHVEPGFFSEPNWNAEREVLKEHRMGSLEYLNGKQGRKKKVEEDDEPIVIEMEFPKPKVDYVAYLRRYLKHNGFLDFAEENRLDIDYLFTDI